MTTFFRARSVLFCLAVVVACGDNPQPYKSPSGLYTFAIPASWSGAVTTRPVGPGQGPGPYGDAIDFVYAPQDTTVRPQILLRLVVYRIPVWDTLLAEGGPPPGEEVGRLGGKVVIAGLPQSNPFAPGSPDARGFDRLVLSLEDVKRAVSIVEPASGLGLAVHPLAIRGQDSIMQAQAESCLTAMIRALEVERIAATLVPPAAPRGDLQSATIARFSIEGELEKVGDDYRMELRLMDAASGEELRSYFYSGEDPAGIGRTCPSAAPRIAQAIRETPLRP